MSQNYKKIYLAYLSVTAFFLILLGVIFVLDPEETGGEGEYILPGDSTIEGFYPLIIVPVLLICGIIALFLASKIFLKIYVKTLGKNKKIGMVQPKELDNSELVKKIFLRSILLIFFILNICYTLVSQEAIVKLMRSPDPNTDYSVPDAPLMYEIAFLLAIPCSLILIPIWAMNDSGLVASKKNNALEFENVDLASGTMYKVIKGYAGIGFLYSFTMMLINWVMASDEPQYMILQMLSPIMFISFAFPIVIYLEMHRNKLREKMWKTLNKLQMANKFALSINLMPMETYEDLKK